MMSLTFGLFTQVSGSGPLGPLVYVNSDNSDNAIPAKVHLIHFLEEIEVVIHPENYLNKAVLMVAVQTEITSQID